VNLLLRHKRLLFPLIAVTVFQSFAVELKENAMALDRENVITAPGLEKCENGWRESLSVV
jgi:hypothetical protein